jgi:hypothetical protein
MAIGNFQPSPLGRSSRSHGTCSAVANGFDGDVFGLYQRSPGVYVSLGNSKFKIPAGEYAAQLSIHGSAIVPATSAMSLVCTNWAEHLDHHQARKPSSTKPSEGFTADGGSWGQRPLAVPFRYGRDVPRSGDLREIRIDPPLSSTR